jgi:Family of unknown function (DUF6496)
VFGGAKACLLRARSSFHCSREHIGEPGGLAGIQISPRRRNYLVMPEEDAIERAREDQREGLSPSTQAGEFVREEMEHIREGKHGARSPQQAIAIGLSKARRAGVKLPPPKRGKQRTKRQAKRDLAKGRRGRRKPSPTRSRAVRGALKRESRRAASRKALSRQTKRAARSRSAASRSRAAKKAARTRKRRRR